MKFLLDEMHTPVIARALSQSGIDAIAVAATPSSRGLSDPDLLDHAAAGGRVLVTENVEDFSQLVMSRAATGEPHAGVILTNPKRFHRGSLAYPADVISALASLVDDPPTIGDSWVWWL